MAHGRNGASRVGSGAPYDLVIVGGGIIGLGAARDAALRGLRVALVEKEDYGWGTSNRATRLAHGGLRYLEQYDFGLVREDLRERERLLRNAPHLVQPLPFLMPFYRASQFHRLKLRAG
ncbi:MAG TPA: FAD-dependent oxidoreductase, partial [Chloroflexota bacterium]|nr:FAD-dependent oxidoreductase [Chloroflexota bacterium]